MCSAKSIRRRWCEYVDTVRCQCGWNRRLSWARNRTATARKRYHDMSQLYVPLRSRFGSGYILDPTARVIISNLRRLQTQPPKHLPTVLPEVDLPGCVGQRPGCDIDACFVEHAGRAK